MYVTSCLCNNDKEVWPRDPISATNENEMLDDAHDDQQRAMLK